MADQIPYSIAEKILTKLGSLAVQEIELARGARKELPNLVETLTTIKAVLLNAEEQQQDDPGVENWVRRFKDVIYDADDLLDDFAAYELGRGGIARQVSRFFSSSNQVAFHFRMGHRIKDIRGRLDGIANDISRYNFISRATTSRRVGNTGTQTHSFVLTSEIMGRDEDKKKIIKLLLQSNNEENLSIVAIVGIGGLGKTTLAQLVYNDQEVLKHFDLRLWVCVSEDFDGNILVRNIIKSATDENVDTLGLEQLKNKLHGKLNSKKYLLVLDDVWNEDFEKWDQLRILLKVGARGSKVLVTTRNSKVASTMGIDSPYVLKGLNEGQSWALFKSRAFGDNGQNARPNLLQIGEEITKMCNGVPLVIKTLGRILHSKTEESQWVSIQKNKNLMLLRDGDNILKVLKLSYDNLPSHLKQCFTYCALFPKDYEIKKKMLIQLWIAQGYIQPLDENEHLEDAGDHYFKELLSRSMFQEVNNRYKMHDLIYDMAQLIVKSEIFILTNVQTTIPERIHHLSISGWSQGMTVLKEKSLRTLFASDYDDSCANSMVNGLVLNCKCLRVLDLGAGSKAIKLPKSVIKLGHLRYLSLSCGEFEVLPSGFTSLQNLQTLKLWRCEHLKELPRNIRKMINLRHLEIDGCRRLNYMPCRLGELTMLQTLHLAYLDAMEYMFENSSSTEPFFPSLKTLKLDELCNFKGWWREIAGEQAPSFPSLSQLLIRNCGQLTTVQLPSCPSLSTLKITKCGQLTTVQLPSCPSLSGLQIYACGQLTTVQLPSCPSLSRLEIYGCGQLTTVQLPSCPSLSILEIYECGQLTTVQLPSCPSLSILEIYECGQLTTVQLPSCPFLSTLEISECGQLTTVQLPSCPSLSTLKIDECDQLTTLQLPSCPSLSTLRISDGQLPTVPSCSSLSELEIISCNQLTTLKLPSCSSLSKLQIWFCNQLTTLELPSCPSLSTLEIDGCDQLTTVQLISSPHLSKLVINNCGSLESLQLPACPSLSELRIQCCYQLTVQQLPSCPELSELEIICCNQLTTVQLLSSPHLSKLFIGYCENLKSLQLPSCPSLSTLEIDECDQLTTVQLISSPHLSKLVIYNCESLESLQLPACPSLSELRIKCCYQLTVQQLPSCTELSELEIIGCYQLTTVQLLSSPHLSKLFIRYCENLKSLQLPSCPSLSELQIIDCHELTTVQLLSSPRLSKLYIESCICLESLLLSSLPCLEELILGGLPKETLWRIILVSSSLKSLHISGRKSLPDDRLQHITSLKSLFQGIQHLGALEELRINHCNLSDKEDDDGGLQFQGLRSLRKLFITGIPKLVSLPKGLQHVTTLEIRSCDGLIMSQFQGIQHLGALEELRIYNCNLSDKEDDDGGLQFQGFRSLRKLFISEIPKLVSLPTGLQHVTTLETLSITCCSDFTTLPDWISSLTSLSELKIERCPRFKLEDSSKIAHIPTIHIVQRYM
ncbi:putative disease resistance protein RGA3 [Vitis riparia]|uniref:putative disease resistance protein RGA3 n=1 Tax=Vitis riparia TaxID=96939 RepID=UPI00155A57A5|nr:putative disease resistance protein RGA3 [Vitis riparia]XP_034705558.1 putative disease resistance protein RGA3 [Vitis riparia]XP_034705559.1 putative disease resistance protein RGA3 [Vitis riparia]XP_034705560.1 putative disease resistance protein RGA3 [Vitis riparia]XP_034705562.1 putative disease resistance protein RGA3 [Vitis riparia]XP_034705563.1 putative disease resistance protein RGA3 [Vitis riparia]XP_034705564.1 putative disease resistance protein RGA3 [Vitis riparia]XP_03470556